MVNKAIFFSLFILFGCGNTTTVDSKKLESFSTITNSGTVKLDKTGSLQRGDGRSKDEITFENQSYYVSMYSSYSALEYIAKKPLNYKESVKFKGTLEGDEVVLESIEAE